MRYVKECRFVTGAGDDMETRDCKCTGPNEPQHCRMMQQKDAQSYHDHLVQTRLDEMREERDAACDRSAARGEHLANEKAKTMAARHALDAVMVKLSDANEMLAKANAERDEVRLCLDAAMADVKASNSLRAVVQIERDSARDHLQMCLEALRFALTFLNDSGLACNTVKAAIAGPVKT